MRVLIVTQYFWPEDFRINDLALGLKELGWDVTVLTGKPNYPGGTFFAGYGFFKHNHDNYEGIPIIRIPLIARGRGGAVRLALNYLSFALLASVLGPLRCCGRFDMIFVYAPSPVTVGLPAIALKKWRGGRIFFWIQDLWPESLSATGMVRSAGLLAMVERLVRYIYRRCDRLLVQSRAFIEPIGRLGIDPERIMYYPNSAEALYQPTTMPAGAEEYARMPSGFRVMFAGNIGAAQDFATILAAAEELKAKWTYTGWCWVTDAWRPGWPTKCGVVDLSVTYIFWEGIRLPRCRDSSPWRMRCWLP